MKTHSTIYASFLVCKDAGSSGVNLLKVDCKKENLKVVLHCFFWLFCIVICWQHIVPFYMFNNLGQELDEMESRAMRLAMPTSTRAIKQGMRLKLQEMPQKTAMKTPVGVFEGVSVT